MANNSKWVKVGTVMKKRPPKTGTHVVVQEDVTLKKGTYLQIFDPRQRTNKDGSKLTEEQLANIPDYVVKELFLVRD